MSTIRTSTATFLGLLIFAVGLRVGSAMTHAPLLSLPTNGSGSVLSDPAHQADLSLLFAAWNVLNQSYIDPTALTSKKLIEGATAGLVRGVGDPYTIFLSKQDVKEFDDSLNGNLEGIGAELDQQGGAVLVSRPLPDSPALRGGLKAGDVIIKIDGTVIEGWTLSQVVTHVRGTAGTKVQLTVLRRGVASPLTLTFTRAKIHIPSMEASTQKTASGTVGIIALHQFGDTSTDEVKAALQGFLNAHVKGLVIDLRGNGGGYLEGAISLTSLFLKEGVVVSVDQRGVPREEHSVDGSAIAPDLPLSILIDGGTASASEIFAGALQDHKRAIVVGQDSFGKGTVQEIFQLPEGASLKVTIAHWITPNGRNLGKDVIHPDIPVDPGTGTGAKDPQLQAAIGALFPHPKK